MPSCFCLSTTTKKGYIYILSTEQTKFVRVYMMLLKNNYAWTTAGEIRINADKSTIYTAEIFAFAVLLHARKLLYSKQDISG